MEDVHCCFPAVNISGGGSNVCSVYGVLDGHGGVECSRFAVEEMPPQIVAALRSGLSSSQALFNSFTNTDEVKSANMCVVFGSLLSEYNFCY
jgi:serine/threonine protein phosphatase PrpC